MISSGSRFVLAVLAAAVLWGTTGTVAHQAPADSPQIVVGMSTFGFGGVLLFLLDARAVLTTITHRDTWPLLLAGALGMKPLFDYPARVLLTLLYQRQVCSMNVLADLLEVTATCIGDLVKKPREILEVHGHDPGVAPARFTTCDALLAFTDSDLRPARATVIDRLSHPALTGLTPRELHDLTSRLAARQAAQAERLSYQRHGGPRQPGTRGGVFHQKISNSERILVALLYNRRLCTLDVLADALSDVSRSAVGGVIREILPLFQREDHLPQPAPTPYRTAAELLAAGTRKDTAS